MNNVRFGFVYFSLAYFNLDSYNTSFHANNKYVFFNNYVYYNIFRLIMRVHVFKMLRY